MSGAFVNARFFDKEWTDTLLAARGFDKSGRRSGGIINPQKGQLLPGDHIVRLYHEPKAKFGQWWSSPYELQSVVDHFARGGEAFAVGRPIGKGILHATLAVRHDWGGNSPDHLGRFWVARIMQPLLALSGEGDHAPDASQTANQKTALIIGADGRQRGVRQLFLPQAWTYQDAFHEVSDGVTDRDLLPAIAALGGKRLHFEV